eukprot:4983649-Pleurochrysis_carterae.AAC.1
MAHRPVPVSAAHKGFNKKGKKAVAAAAASKNDSTEGAGGNTLDGRRPYELPDGQWCSKGTCHFTHDKVNPEGPCYRDPRWPGLLPDKVLNNKQQVERIKNAIETNNAKRMNISGLPILSALAPMDYGNETLDVSGIGLRFMFVNPALPAMDDDA